MGPSPISSPPPTAATISGKRSRRESPVRIQWDPEKNLQLRELAWRSIQIGIGGIAVDLYVDQWIVAIEDLTPLAKDVKALVDRKYLAAASELAPAKSLIRCPNRSPGG